MAQSVIDEGRTVGGACPPAHEEPTTAVFVGARPPQPPRAHRSIDSLMQSAGLSNGHRREQRTAGFSARSSGHQHRRTLWYTGSRVRRPSLPCAFTLPSTPHQDPREGGVHEREGRGWHTQQRPPPYTHLPCRGLAHELGQALLDGLDVLLRLGGTVLRRHPLRKKQGKRRAGGQGGGGVPVPPGLPLRASPNCGPNVPPSPAPPGDG